MTAQFQMVQGDLSLQADYAQPAFDLLRDSTKSYEALFSALARYGLRLGDMKLEQGNGSLGDVHLQCSLFDFTTSVRVRLEKTEITCYDVTRVKREQLEELTVSALEAVGQSLSSDISFKTYSLGIALHGLLPDADVKEFLGRFIATVPQNLGPPLGAGCLFYFGAEGEQISSSLAMDLSGPVENGLFLRLWAVWDAEKIEIKDIPAATSRHIEKTLADVGLALSEP